MYTCGTAAEYQPERLYREAQAVRALDFPAEFVRDAGLPFQTCGAVVFPNMAQFHPLRFLHGIARGLHIFARTYAERIDLKTNTVHTSRGRIRAKKIVVATHFPFFNRRGLYFAKLYQTRSYVAALGHAPQLPYSYWARAKAVSISAQQVICCLSAAGITAPVRESRAAARTGC